MHRDHRRSAVAALLAAGLALLALCAPAGASVSLRELTRLGGQGESTLRGLGIVTGLPGTGDSGPMLPMARQLARLLELSGSPIPDVEELFATENAAIVLVTCTIPREGARAGDKFDCYVQAWHNAESLRGGRLFITPLQGPLPGQGVFAFAEGEVVIDDPTVPTSGRARNAARISRDIEMTVMRPNGTISLLVEPRYAGWTTTRLIADLINDEFVGIEETRIEIAHARSEREVLLEVPQPELGDPSGFIARILEIQLDPSLLALPARVIVNEKRGTIVVTGNVEISPAAFAHNELVVTVVTPARQPTPGAPDIQQSNWAEVDTFNDERNLANLRDLLDTLRVMAVPVSDQIALLKQLHRSGRLHAEFIEE